MNVSLIIRTYNESRHLPELLQTVKSQVRTFSAPEILVVDSGSTDETREIAIRHGCRVLQIPRQEFSFGRSLNIGCEAARGDVLVFVSGHCIPASESWLERLVRPIGEGSIVLSYGRQIGNGYSRFSECRLFEKYFPPISAIPQQGFFCNNANAALDRDTWARYKFEEELTGLEDMHLGQRLVSLGMKIAYVSDAPVYHLHTETWRQVRRRFEREAIALQHVMPEVHISFTDFLRYLVSSILLDAGSALQQGVFMEKIGEIVLYRSMQYRGSYRGNNLHRKLSRARKDLYYYPR